MSATHLGRVGRREAGAGPRLPWGGGGPVHRCSRCGSHRVAVPGPGDVLGQVQAPARLHGVRHGKRPGHPLSPRSLSVSIHSFALVSSSGLGRRAELQ
ncbi:hypothetical protein NDU88_001101 [Pleurodeles waltl]|uniref:Uncharacterized protein n=1 Tax=Pleurodeles waltl TaxID=8319 RepID=A0AAV7KRZ8_PLEWA|nr:hypothetical protein NDU88_001101 [Pleurodeles waltl]